MHKLNMFIKSTTIYYSYPINLYIFQGTEKPLGPKVDKVTHHTVQLQWEETLENAGNYDLTGDDRIRVTLQQEEPGGQWMNIYV